MLVGRSAVGEAPQVLDDTPESDADSEAWMSQGDDDSSPAMPCDATVTVTVGASGSGCAASRDQADSDDNSWQNVCTEDEAEPAAHTRPVSEQAVKRRAPKSKIPRKRPAAAVTGRRAKGHARKS